MYLSSERNFIMTDYNNVTPLKVPKMRHIKDVLMKLRNLTHIQQ